MEKKVKKIEKKVDEKKSELVKKESTFKKKKKVKRNITSGIAYVYSKNKRLENYINADFVNEVDLGIKDQNLVLRFIRNHIFHTDSSMGKRIVDNWDHELQFFRKLKPTALDIVDLDDIYNLHVADRINVMLNE